MREAIAIGIGGVAGALFRHGLSGRVQKMFQGIFPLGTLFVNLLGSFLIGMLMALVEERGAFSRSTRLFLVTGFLGSFTTFSTFSYETFTLFKGGSSGAALFNLAAHTLLGILAVACGWLLGARMSL